MRRASTEDGPHAVGILRDITERKAVEQQLKLGERIVQHALSGIMVTDPNQTIQLVNPAFSRVTGYAGDEVVGRQPTILKSGRHDDEFYKSMWQMLAETGEWQGEIWNRRKNGEVYPEWLSLSAIRDRQGNVTHYVGVFSDITQQKQLERDLERLALHDPLTGLANRTLFRERLSRCVQGIKRNPQRQFCVIFLDLDLFKNVNDQYGHETGDLLLQEAARRLALAVRETDTVARLGGDEFAVIMEGVGDAAPAEVKAAGIIGALSRPFVFGAIQCRVGVSVGIAICPDHGDSEEALLKKADDAMYEAKNSGGNRFRMAAAYAPEIEG